MPGLLDRAFVILQKRRYAHYHGSVRIDAFEESRMHDPVIRALMPQIRLTIDPKVDAEFPARRAAHVSITTYSGQKFSYYQATMVAW